MSKFLAFLKPVLKFVPEVQKPARMVPFRSKLLWTFATLSLFLLYSRIPLVGLGTAKGSDPFYWMRAIMASNRGTLMELGISPILTSGMIMQLLQGTGIIKIDMGNKSERALFNSAQKLMGLLFTVFQAVAYVLSGVYGPFRELGFFTAFLITLQLSMSGFCITLLDELLQKGYGLGSGISIFIATNTCENIVWQCFSPNTYNFGRGTEFEGCLIALVHLLITRADKGQALVEAFTRQNLPNVGSFLSTIIVFILVVYFQGVRVEISLSSKQARNYQGSYPIKLFYTSNTPIILQSSLMSLVGFISQMLYNAFPKNFIVNLIGRWVKSEYSSQPQPESGLVYYITQPSSFSEIAQDPLHFIIYLVFTVVVSGFFSKMWVGVSGSSAKDVAQQLKSQGMQIKGHRDENMVHELNRYIPTAASFGGMCIGLFTIVADLLGCMGSGTGILLAVTTVYDLFETIIKESAETGLFNF
ncbi:putative Protein transport protein Sec61 subunit alpha [Blattamonas nauphoetae]|uniref:Translocon Sec61/SecY plug domain-containing protein n=1 Tax=Blattamonas nauphoetae TaxID=2049346 RepID=A0ABQ9XL55_9EUKA|nr:putative Protein transport protein Sec61 subunit alpha [Blattamonas nauphoetae]